MLLLLFNDYNSETKTDPAVQEPVKGSRETLLMFNQLCVIILCADEWGLTSPGDPCPFGSGGGPDGGSSMGQSQTPFICTHCDATQLVQYQQSPFTFIVFCGDQQ